MAISEVIKVGAIPLIAALVGYATNWLAVRMMFRPMQPRGIGPFKWQGVIPAKAAKMGSISVDTGLAKLGDMEEFYAELDPERIAEHIVAHSRQDIRELTEQTIRREHPSLWGDLGPELREEVHTRVQSQLPEIMHDITAAIGEHIDQLMDLKLMVVRHMGENPILCNRIFSDVGEREFRFIVYSGGAFGFVLGLVQMGAYIAFPFFWILPVFGAFVGYATNWLALNIIFRPVRPRKVGPFTIQGLFLRRQDEVAETYASIITDDVLTMRHLAQELMHGPKNDRTRELMRSRLRPSIDEALGQVQPAVRLAVGSREYDAVRDELAVAAVEPAEDALTDPEFNEERSAVLRGLMAKRMAALPATDFAELLRSAFEEDEWQLIAVGSVLGLFAGILQIATVF
ncbi:MAG: DUF445 domain-containing protein [Solirubrobacterales bacterium]